MRGAGAAFRFRPAEEADLPRLVAINRSSFLHPWSEELVRRELSHPWSTVLVAAGGQGEVLGFVVFWTVHDEVHVLNVAVAPEHRRRGVAAALMAEAEAHGRARGARLVTLEVRRGNEAAIALYRRLGYQEVAVRPGYYQEEGEDAIVMDLRL